jgi:hypothetical protein
VAVAVAVRRPPEEAAEEAEEAEAAGKPSCPTAACDRYAPLRVVHTIRLLTSLAHPRPVVLASARAKRLADGC